MVTSEVDQFSRECSAWIDALRSQRETLGQMNAELQDASAHLSDQESLKEVDHFQNQIYIQQVNVRDLKHFIKQHYRKGSAQLASVEGRLSEDSFAEHERLYDDFLTLQHTLLELQNEFNHFLAHAG